MQLRELTASSRRLALVGLAKNTGKTVALTALLGELERGGPPIGLTSVGRDGEEHDAIDFRIAKPRLSVRAGTLVATTDALLHAAGVAHELLEQTNVRTPLGRVVLARISEDGALEVAGPSAAADVRAVSDAMLAHGAERVLIDGAIDRRAASSPEVSDGLVISTGAILSADIEEVVARTAAAVALVRLRSLARDGAEERLRDLAETQGQGVTLLVDEHLQPHPTPARFVLAAEPPVIEGFLRDGVVPRWLLVSGALPAAFLDGLASFTRRAMLSVTVVVSDPTHVFLAEHGPDWYARQGVHLLSRRSIALRAITVNPVAPLSHRFDSGRLRGLLGEAISDVPIFDVCHPEYRGTQRPAGA